MDTLTPPVAEPDPIDLLIPPPRPWWVRLVVALVAVGLVGTCSVLVGFGYLVPRPECCGSGSGSSDIVLSPEGDSVIVHAYAFNSSGRDLMIESIDVDLPGARVLGSTVNRVPRNGGRYELGRGESVPTMWPGHGSVRIAIEFVPESCRSTAPDWGRITVQLDVVNAWLPSIDRSYRLPDPVVDGPSSMSVWPPDDSIDWYAMDDPLEVACRLLETAPS
jgi:hypothetical protein